ncbi:hypothetical protein F4802DRAFT_294042 [Xylaria palmicola]|nr:hypothetical protein F4802DRAFT_294042 [Xylaria palmicola]
MDELMSRKRVDTSDVRLSTRKKRLKPKPQSPLHESYSGVREGRGTAALTDPATSSSLPFPFHLPPYAPAVANNTSLVWGDASGWSSVMSSGSVTGSWDQYDAVRTTTASPGFAPRERDQFATSASDLELPLPTVTQQSSAVGDSGTGGGNCVGGSGDVPSNKSLGKWPAPAHSTPPLVPPFVNFLSHPSMSYTDAHTHAHVHAQSIDLMDPFAPGSDVADYAPGFTRTGLGVTNTSFGNPLVDGHGIPVFPHDGKPHASGDTLDSAFIHPITHYHSEDAPNASHYLEEPDLRHFGINEPWYEEGLGASPDLAPNSHLLPHRPSVVGELRLDNDLGVSLAAFGRPTPQPRHVVLAGKRAERARRPRGQLLPKDREETSKTRKWKACIRCRMQKIRCIPDPAEPEKKCCVCCGKVLGLETKKVIHRIPCLRWNLNEVVLFRVGGLGLTQRWAGVCVENIPSSDWADERVITIGLSVTKLLCDPIPLKVRRFKPNSTDVQFRYFRYKETEPPLVVTTPAYALADVDATSEEYRSYVQRNAEEAIRRFVGDTTVTRYVRRTFSVAIHHSAKATHKNFGRIKGDPATLFRNYFRLWLASRFTLGSAYVADGHENLEGTSPPCVLAGMRYVSRMITAQFDSIGYNHVLAKLKREVLDELWLLMQKRTDSTFFSVYLVVFMMLHEVSVACQDRRRRAKEQGLETYYDLEDATAKIKHSADILLGHWHYYKGDVDPLSMSEASMTRAFGADAGEEIRLLVETCQAYEQMKKKPRDEVDWEDPLCLVSQMFERDWRPMRSAWP